MTIIGLAGASATAAAGYFFGWWAALPGILTAALLSFYRDPPRRVPQRPNAVLAPADGRIMRIEDEFKTPEGESALRIVIFLSVLNVHVNRAPCAGKVVAIDYRRGKCLNALYPESTDLNESNRVVLEPAAPLPGPIHFRQITGLLAKRIVCRLKPGDVVAAGERYGMIKLGSQTELTLPRSRGWRILVKVGDSVRGGLTVLAEHSQDHQHGAA